MPTVFPSGTYGHMIVNTSGIVHYMRMNDSVGSGDDADSLDGTGSNVTYRQTGALAGDPSKSIYFNGTSSYITYGNNVSLTGPFTIEVWIRPTKEYSSGFGTFLSKENYNVPWSGWGFYLQGRSASNGYMRAAFARLNGGVNYVSNVVYSSRIYPNVWTYLVATYDGYTLRMYRNAVYEWDTPSAGGMNTSSYPLLAGAESNASATYYSNRFQGGIDEFAVYNRALSQTEITNHYNRGKTAPVQYYALKDSDKFTATETRTTSSTRKLTDLRTISRVEAKTQKGFMTLSDARALSVTEARSIITAFGGTLESFYDSDKIVASESRSLYGRISTSDQESVLRTSERTDVTAHAILQDNRVLGATEQFSSRVVVRASAIFPRTLKRQSGLIHFLTSEYVREPYKILYHFNDVVPIGDSTTTPFVVVDYQNNPLILGFATTAWNSSPIAEIIIDISLQVDDFPELLESFGLTRKQRD